MALGAILASTGNGEAPVFPGSSLGATLPRSSSAAGTAAMSQADRSAR